MPSVDNPEDICTKVVPGGESGITLLVRCYMTYKSSNVLGTVNQYKSVDGHIWIYISEGDEKWLPFSEWNSRLRYPKGLVTCVRLLEI